MIKLIGLKQVPYPGRNLYELFADTKKEVVEGATIIGLPEDYSIPAGSKITIADGTIGYYKSDNTWSWVKSGGGKDPVLIEKSITENGDYFAADDDADGYSSVSVDVEPDLTTKNITQNGTYQASQDNADGYSEVTVNVPATKYDIQGTLFVDNGKVYTPEGYYQTTNISEYAFFNMVINLPEEGNTIADESFSGWLGLHTVNIPNHYTDIGQATFNTCSDLIHVNIPTSVTELKHYIFRGCAFTSMNIPEGVTIIDSYAFYECANLTTVTIPSTVTEIGTEAFGSCTALTSVTCNATTPPSLGSEVFINTSSDLVIYVPAESLSAYGSSQWSGLNIQAIPTE